jgi:hypothetical protein
MPLQPSLLGVYHTQSVTRRALLAIFPTRIVLGLNGNVAVQGFVRPCLPVTADGYCWGCLRVPREYK